MRYAGRDSRCEMSRAGALMTRPLLFDGSSALNTTADGHADRPEESRTNSALACRRDARACVW
jgi:hypothetical protein